MNKPIVLKSFITVAKLFFLLDIAKERKRKLDLFYSTFKKVYNFFISYEILQFYLISHLLAIILFSERTE